MRTIKISISDFDFERFGLQSSDYTFDEWVDLISRELSKQRLEKSIELSEKYGLSSMTMDDINAEIKAARKDAKDNS